VCISYPIICRLLAPSLFISTKRNCSPRTEKKWGSESGRLLKNSRNITRATAISVEAVHARLAPMTWMLHYYQGLPRRKTEISSPKIPRRKKHFNVWYRRNRGILTALISKKKSRWKKAVQNLLISWKPPRLHAIVPAHWRLDGISNLRSCLRLDSCRRNDSNSSRQASDFATTVRGSRLVCGCCDVCEPWTKRSTDRYQDLIGPTHRRALQENVKRLRRRAKVGKQIKNLP